MSSEDIVPSWDRHSIHRPLCHLIDQLAIRSMFEMNCCLDEEDFVLSICAFLYLYNSDHVLRYRVYK